MPPQRVAKLEEKLSLGNAKGVSKAAPGLNAGNSEFMRKLAGKQDMFKAMATAIRDKELEVEDKGDQSLETLLDRMARL